MAVRPKRAVVVGACVVAVALGLIGALVFTSSPSSVPQSPPAACVSPSDCPTPILLTPTNSTLLPEGSQRSPVSGDVEFSLLDPGDLRGAWEGSSPLAVAVFNATTASLPNYGWPCPGCYQDQGEINYTLFPGTYLLEILGGGTFTVTQSIVVNFDRGLEILQSPTEMNILSGGNMSWPISLPAGATGVWLEAWLAQTGCNYSLFIQPANVSMSPQLITAGYGSSCPTPPVSTVFGPGAMGPLNITSGDSLVFYNGWSDSVQLSVLYPIEVSYLSTT
jgi:hypothetical protein